MSDLEAILRRDLATITMLWSQLLNLPRIPTAHVNGRTEPPLPVPVGVLSLRRESGEILADIAHMIWDERQFKTPLNLLDTLAVTAFIDRNTNWLSIHAAGKDACDEIGGIAARILELVKQTKPRRIVVGHCPDCEGQLVAYMRPTDAMLPSEVRCSLTLSHRWTPWEWSYLGRRIRRDRREGEMAAMRLVAAIMHPTTRT